MKKIIFVLPQIKTGGGIRVIVELSNVLVKTYDVRFVLPHTQSECTFWIDPKIKIEKIGIPAKSSMDRIKNIVKMFSYLNREYKKEIVITTDPILSPIFLFYRFKQLYRYIQADDYRIFDDLLLLKNRFFLYIYKVMTKISYKSPINYLFNSKYTYDQFVALSGKTVPFRIVHPSINHNVFYKKREQVEKDKLNLCLIARKHPMKRFDDFVHVYKELKQMPHIVDQIANIYIISHDDLSGFDLTGFTMVVPQNDQEIASVMNESDIYIFTSLWEGFGLPPLEAMSCGCAVVASDAKGINEYAINKKNALIYPPTDTAALKASIIELIEDRNLLKSLQQNGIKSAQNFSWDISARQFINHLFKEQIKEQNG